MKLEKETKINLTGITYAIDKALDEGVGEPLPRDEGRKFDATWNLNEFDQRNMTAEQLKDMLRPMMQLNKRYENE